MTVKLGWVNRLGVLLVLLAPLCVSVPAALAQQADANTALEARKPADVRVLIDVSGSMKQNDPDNLRQPALELLVNLLPAGSKAGVWTFGRYINMLVPHRPVTGSWRENAKDKSTDISSVGLFTNIGEALEKAAYDADKPNEKYHTSLILLTDGMVDIDKDPETNQQEWRRIVDEVLPKLERAGYTVHTIALSDNADRALLDKLALATDGMSEVAKNADELMKIFLRVFDQAAPAEQVPLTGNSFLVDSSIEEFTALIFRSPGSDPTVLVSPDEIQYSFDKEQEDVSWYRTEVYDLITVKRPIEGEWQAIAELEPDSRVTIVSNLNLLVKPLPSNVFLGETAELSVLLQDKGKTITRTDFLNILDVDNEVLHPTSDGQWRQELSDGPAPFDGIYRSELDMFDVEGRFELTLSVDGKSFKRQYRHQISVRKPFEATVEKLVLGGREQYRIGVKAHSQVIDPAETQVVARIRDPKGRSSIKPIQLTPTDEWELILKPELQGTYHIRLRISGTDTTGVSFDVDPQPLSFQYPDGDPFAASSAADLAEAKPETPPEEMLAKPVAVELEEQETEAALEEQEPETDEAEEGSRWPLYVGLGLGNLLIMGLAFFAYRMIMGGGKGDSLKDLESAVDETEQMADAPPAEEPASDEPQMEEIQSIETEGASDADLAAQLAADMDMGGDDAFDLASDSVADAEISELSAEPSDESIADDLLADLGEDPFADMSLDAAEPVVAGESDDAIMPLEEDEPSDEASIEDALEGFSLDDFAPEDLDSLDDDDTPKT